MSVSTIIAALQTLHSGVTGIASAPTAMPASLSTADMPTVVTFPAEATWEQITAGGLRRVDRTFLVRCYVAPAAQGSGVDEGYQKCLPIIQAMGELYIANQSITAADDRAVIISSIADRGLDGQLLFAGVAYRGFEFRVEVTEKW